MVSYEEMLEIYNKLNDTDYATLEEFASKLLEYELKKAYSTYRQIEAARQAEKELTGV